MATDAYDAELVFRRQEGQTFDQNLDRQPGNRLAKIALIYMLSFQASDLSENFIICQFDPALVNPVDDVISDGLDRARARNTSRDLPRGAIIDGLEYPQNHRVELRK